MLSAAEARKIEDRVVGIAREELAAEAERSKVLKTRITSMQAVIDELRAQIQTMADTEDELNAALEEARAGTVAAQTKITQVVASAKGIADKAVTDAIAQLEARMVARIQDEKKARQATQATLDATLQKFGVALSATLANIAAPKPKADYEVKITERGPNNNIRAVSVVRK